LKILPPTNYKLPLKIGIVCYPSVGGSGIVATNLGIELAKLGHQVHFISYDPPFRLDKEHPNIFFHKVNINQYPLFKYPDYTLPLTVTMGAVHEEFLLDVFHVHYAVPHATAALLAYNMLAQCSSCKPPKVITTLHGTDITLLARDKNLFEIIKYSIEQSHGVTAVSKSLRKETLQVLSTKKDIEVIYNFYTPPAPRFSRDEIRKKLGITPETFLAIHLSNLRPVKRIPDLLKVVSLIKTKKPFKLLILAGGKFDEYNKLVHNLKIGNSILVKKNVKAIEDCVPAADVGLYTSENESFGMGILETMSYGIPIISTSAGGIPEVVKNDITGFLTKVGDVKALAGKLTTLIKNPTLQQQMGKAAAEQAQKHFSAGIIVQKYLDYYGKIIRLK